MPRLACADTTRLQSQAPPRPDASHPPSVYCGLRAPLTCEARKPRALSPGGTLRIVSPASPAERTAFHRGVAELERLGYRVRGGSPGREARRLFRRAARPPRSRSCKRAAAIAASDAVICARGGYGSSALLDRPAPPAAPRSPSC